MPEDKKRTKDPAEERAALRDEEAEVGDDLETAQAKSGSVDERIPERYGSERPNVEAPAPAAHIPQGGLAVPAALEDESEGEQVLEKEREHLRIRKSSG